MQIYLFFFLANMRHFLRSKFLVEYSNEFDMSFLSAIKGKVKVKEKIEYKINARELHLVELIKPRHAPDQMQSTSKRSEILLFFSAKAAPRITKA